MGSGSSAAAGVKRIQVLAGAQRDLGEAVAFYRARDERIVARFVAVVDDHLELIAEHPARAPIATGTKGPTEYRRLKVQGFPFGILYRVHDDTVEVVAVAHERRRPGYWSRR